MLFLHLSSLLALIYLAKAYGVRRALVVAVFVTGASIYVESLGVKHGFCLDPTIMKKILAPKF